MIKNVVISLLGAAFIGLLGFLLQNMAGTMTEIRDDIRGVRVEINDVRGEIGTLRTEIGDIRGEIGDVRGEIGTLRTELTERLTRIEETQKNHTKLLDGMKDHGERIATLEGILISPPKEVMAGI